MKSVFNTWPIFHKRSETIRGHVFCSFLTLILMKEFKTRLANKGWKLEWDRLIRDLDHLKEIEVSRSRAIGRVSAVRCYRDIKATLFRSSRLKSQNHIPDS